MFLIAIRNIINVIILMYFYPGCRTIRNKLTVKYSYGPTLLKICGFDGMIKGKKYFKRITLAQVMGD